MEVRSYGRGTEKKFLKNVPSLSEKRKDSLVSLFVSKPFCPCVWTDIQVFTSGIGLSCIQYVEMQLTFVHIYAFRVSMRLQAAFLPCLQVRTFVVFYTKVSQVRIEGMELRKRYGPRSLFSFF